MGALRGNEFWKQRSSHGRDPIFKTPEELWSAACEYFQWCEDNPLQEDKLFSYQGAIVRDTVNKLRAMTISGLCLFVDISEDTWANYRKRDDFLGVVTRAERIIYYQKFTGAAADLLNSNIIARDLQLKETSKHELTGEDGGPIEYTNTERAARLAAILERARKDRDRQSDKPV